MNHQSGFPAVLSLAAALIALFGLAVSGAAASPQISSPGAFSDEFEGEIASDGKGLWLATVGVESERPVRWQVLSYESGKWRQLGGRPKTSSGYATYLTARKNRSGVGSSPCYGVPSPAGVAGVKCFEDGSWKEKRIAPQFKGMTLGGLHANSKRLTASFYGWKGHGLNASTTVRAARLKGGTLVPLGPPVRLKGQYWALLINGEPGSRSRGIDVSIRNANSGERWIQRFSQSGTSRSKALTDVIEGSSGSSPVKLGDTAFFPVNQEYDYVGSDRTPSMSVFRFRKGRWAEVGGSPVSSGFGFAQGSVSLVGDRAWAVWQENARSKTGFGGMLPTKVFAAQVNRKGTGYGKRIRLWKGEVVFPGPVSAVQYRGKPVFLYNRQFGRKDGLHATVDFSHR